MKIHRNALNDEPRSVDLESLVRGFATVIADAVAERITHANVASGVAAPKSGREEGERLMLTVEEAARRLAVGRTVVYGLIKSGELETVLIGRSRRVPTEALEKYVRILRGYAN